MAHVYVTRELPFPALDRLRAEHEVDVWPERLPPPPDELRRRAAGADGLLTMLTDRVDAELLDAAPHVRAIANLAVGTDNIDLTAAAERGVAVGSTPDVLTDATADLTWALILAAARRTSEAERFLREGNFDRWGYRMFWGMGLSGKQLGILGLGRIGRAVAAATSTLSTPTA